MELFLITLKSANYVRWSTDPKELWKNTWFQNIKKNMWLNMLKSWVFSWKYNFWAYLHRINSKSCEFWNKFANNLQIQGLRVFFVEQNLILLKLVTMARIKRNPKFTRPDSKCIIEIWFNKCGLENFSLQSPKICAESLSWAPFN